jgi:hypothetical protein
LIGCHDISSEIQGNITIQIYIDNSHIVKLVFNMNVQQVKKQGRKQGDRGKKDNKRKKGNGRKKDNDGGQNKQCKVSIMGT